MNIGIITHYDVHNHGALLQLYALISCLTRQGHNVKALQFDKNYDFLGHDLKSKYNISINSIPIYLDYLKENGIKRTLYNIKKRKTLEWFKKLKDIVGEYYSEVSHLDAVIIGSDEVFALHTGPTPVFFGYCLPSDNVYAYAASFGPTTLMDVDRLHSRAFVKGGLDSMKYITVRDKNSAEVVEALTGKEPPIVDDPVLLYGYREEIENMGCPIDSDYILVYAYDSRMNNPEEVKAIKDYAKRTGLKTLSPGFYHSWCDINVNVDPINLLSYFKYAKVVITDTFHGSIMSIITGASFVVRTRESNHLKLTNLLKEYGLTNRIFNDWSNFEAAISQEINYNAVNAEVERRRAMSMAELQKMLNP